MNLGVDKVRAAVVGIDLHRGHLDMAGGHHAGCTSDVAERVVAANRKLFDWARQQHIPVIHVVTQYRDADEIRLNAFWRTRAEDLHNPRKNVMAHNIIGMPGGEVMPGLMDAKRDWLVDTKKRYNCFVATDLDLLLRCAWHQHPDRHRRQHQQLRPLDRDRGLFDGLCGDRRQRLRRHDRRPRTARCGAAVHPHRLRLRPVVGRADGAARAAIDMTAGNRVRALLANGAAHWMINPGGASLDMVDMLARLGARCLFIDCDAPQWVSRASPR